MTVSERVHSFGPHESLVGIVALPLEGSAADEERPFVIVLNSGLVHRVGPFRLGVLIARMLATRGFRVIASTCPASETARRPRPAGEEKSRS